ncbi:hypothetical protein SEVIR_4G206650v4 [Setaria viridis]
MLAFNLIISLVVGQLGTVSASNTTVCSPFSCTRIALKSFTFKQCSQTAISRRIREKSSRIQHAFDHALAQCETVPKIPMHGGRTAPTNTQHLNQPSYPKNYCTILSFFSNLLNGAVRFFLSQMYELIA